MLLENIEHAALHNFREEDVGELCPESVPESLQMRVHTHLLPRQIFKHGETAQELSQIRTGVAIAALRQVEKVLQLHLSM